MARTARKQPNADEIQRLQKLARRSTFFLRLTRMRRVTPPVLIVKERIPPERRTDTKGLKQPRAKSVERGTLHGPAVRSCRPLLKRLLESVQDDQGIALGLERFMTPAGLKHSNINLPLDEEAGAKLALFFSLQVNLHDIERIELIGRRIALFSREEATYWLANITPADRVMASWAVRGLRLMLCGDTRTEYTQDLLTRLRARG